MRSKTVCYCIGVDERTIVHAIRQGAHTLKAIRETTKACTGNHCRTLNPGKQCCSRDILALIQRETGRTGKSGACRCH